MMFRTKAWNIFQCHNDGVVYYFLSMGLRVGVQYILSSLFSVGYVSPFEDGLLRSVSFL